MERHVKTLESIVEIKLSELESITTGGWQIYRRHEKGGENSMDDITIEKRNDLQAEIRDLRAVLEAVRPRQPVHFQTEVK